MNAPGTEPTPPIDPKRHTRRALLQGTFAAGAAATAGLGSGCRSAQTGPEGGDSAAQDERGALKELFAHLSDQRSSVEPISSAERAARRARLAGVMDRAGVDALVMEAGATMTYLSGIRWGHSERLFALVVLASGKHFWVCPAFEAERARLSIEAEDGPGGEILTWQEHEYPFEPLASALREHGAVRLGVEPSLRQRFVAGMQAAHGPENVGTALDVVVELRGRKDEHEQALLRRANELTQQAIVAANEHVREGMTRTQVAALMRTAQQTLGLESVWTLALVGPASAYPHGGAHQPPLERGDVILVDTGGSLHGYQSDNTRSWIFDAPVPARVEEVWNVVRDAQKLAFEAIRPGRPCRDIDRVARARIGAGGFGSGYETFTHRLGHGIGLEGHEDPYFDGGSDVILAPGMTLSNEPGIYLYGEFGIRIEDIVVVTASGADHYGTWQRSPASPV
ncbi:MAG: Xaa-Pro dipeptidase [Chlamydiales bacterium]|jgi:Xaa-Pro dipeptidase